MEELNKYTNRIKELEELNKRITLEIEELKKKAEERRKIIDGSRNRNDKKD
jgi:hypothetical protein